MVRQGDLLIVPVNNIPKSAKLQKNRIVELGELTGHMHQIPEGNVYNDSKKREKYIEIVGRPTPLQHEEHKPIVLEPGKYKVTRQREYKPAKRRAQAVVD